MISDADRLKKDILWVGDTLEVIRGFSDEVKKAVGTELMRVQVGLDPTDWKPMKTVGQGVREIRIKRREEHPKR